jgi:hypothetical protein
MNDEPLSEELVRAYEEVAFWRGFIRWWEAKEGRAATPRMREALASAEAKQRDALARSAGNADRTARPEAACRAA